MKPDLIYTLFKLVSTDFTLNTMHMQVHVSNISKHTWTQAHVRTCIYTRLVCQMQRLVVDFPVVSPFCKPLENKIKLIILNSRSRDDGDQTS